VVLFRSAVVTHSIQLDYEFCALAEIIDDGGADGNLAAELGADEAAGAEQAPENALGNS
jgi:hypothetical protein